METLPYKIKGCFKSGESYHISGSCTRGESYRISGSCTRGESYRISGSCKSKRGCEKMKFKNSFFAAPFNFCKKIRQLFKKGILPLTPNSVMLKTQAAFCSLICFV